MSRSRTALLTLAVLATAFSPAPVLAATPSASAASTASAPAKGQPLRCKYFTDGDTAHNYQACVKVLYRMKQNDKLIYSHFVENDTSEPNNRGNCKSTKSKTFRWGGSISVTAEGKAWIFAKVSGTVTASFDRTRTSEVSVASDFAVPPHSTRYCYYVERHEQFMTKQCLTNAYTDGRKCQRRVFYAPAREGWVISDNPIRY